MKVMLASSPYYSATSWVKPKKENKRCGNPKWEQERENTSNGQEQGDLRKKTHLQAAGVGEDETLDDEEV